MKRIREKLNSDIIITIKGIGYRIDEHRRKFRGITFYIKK